MVKMAGRTESDAFCKQIVENLKIFQKEIYQAEDEYSNPDQCVGMFAWVQNSVLREPALVCEPKTIMMWFLPHGGCENASSNHNLD